MKRIFKILIFVVLITSSLSMSILAATLNNGDKFNPQHNTLLAEENEKLGVNLWHWSDGYWKLGGLDSGSKLVYDADVGNYFTGTSKEFSEKLTRTYYFPQVVKDYISIYGIDSLGLSIYTSLSNSVSGSFKYKLYSDRIDIQILPILRYDTANILSQYPSLEQAISCNGIKVNVPWVSNGYGDNLLAVEGGLSYIKLTKEILATAYMENSKMKFNSDQVVYVDSTQGGWKGYKSLRNIETDASVSNGGCFGVTWDTPIKISYFGTPYPFHDVTDIVGSTYVNGSDYWFKANSNIEVQNIFHENIFGLAQQYMIAQSSSGTELSVWNSVATNDTIIDGRNNSVIYNVSSSKVAGDLKRYHAKYDFKASKDVDLDIYSHVISNAGLWTNGKTQADVIASNKKVRVDGNAPTIQSINTSNITPSGFDVKIVNINDNARSGVNHIATKTSKDINWKNTICKDGDTLSFRVDTSNYQNWTGDYIFYIQTFDNVGNSTEKSITIHVPFWTNPSTKYGGIFKDTNNTSVYTSSDNTKWVRPNEEFYILASGFSNSSDQQIDQSDIDIKEITTGEEKIISSGGVRNQLVTKNYWQNTTSSTTIKFIEGMGLTRKDSNGVNNKDGLYIDSLYKLSLSQDGLTYRQSSRMLCIDGGKNFWSSNGNFDFYNLIKVDGIAPDGTVNYDYNEKTADMKIKVSNVIETGSGVQKMVVTYSPKDDPSRVVSENLINNNGNYEGSKNLYTIFGSDVNTINIKITTYDNVGNSRIIANDDKDVFMVQAVIETWLDPHDNNFKCGDKGVLKIKVYGNVDKLKITFPEQMSTRDTTLNKIIDLIPKVYDEVNYEFFVPLQTEFSNYNVEVKAYKKGVEKNVYPDLNVNGSITKDIRTRIRRAS